MAFISNTFRWRDQILAGEAVVEPFAADAAATVDPADIAAVAAVAMTGREQDGEVLAVTGPEALSPSERVRMLGDVLGRDLEMVELTPDRAREHLVEQMPATYATAFAEFYLNGILNESEVSPTVAEVVGRPPARYTDWLARHVDHFTP